MNIIKKFQKSVGLKDDGILGKQTAKAIRDHLSYTNIQAAHYLGQASVETGNFTSTRENGRYSSTQLKKIFSYYKKRPEEADQDQYNEEVILNKVYDDKNRSASLKLGNDKPGDGYKYRGNGPGQTTGKYNHQVVADKIKDQCIMKHPDILWQEYYFKSFDIYLRDKGALSLMKDITASTSLAVTKKVNGPAALHSDRRYSETVRFYKLLTS